MYRVHVVDECLHRLVHSADSLIDSRLLHSRLARKSLEALLLVLVYLCVIQVAVILACELLHFLYFLDIALAHVWCKVEVECWYGLTAVHLVLRSLHTYTAHDARSLDSLSRTARSVTCHKTVLQDLVHRVLHASQTLCWVIIFVVYVQVVVLDSLAHLRAQQVVINEWLCCLAGELHHHSGRSVGVHVRVLASYVIALCLYDFKEHVVSLRTTSNASLVAVCDVLLSDILALTAHQLELHHVLDFLHSHLLFAVVRYVVGYTAQEFLVLARLCAKHRLTDRGSDFLLVEADYTSVTFYYCLNHSY